MAVGTNRWKLGLFVIIGLALTLGVLVGLGARGWSEKTAKYVSFFDESVQGLEVGSPVKFRGVTIGRVAAIDVAIDHRHVQVSSELFVEQLARLGLDARAKGDSGLSIPRQLRVQVAQAGLTGVKFVQLDYFDGSAYPTPVLPFKTPVNTIPSTPSTMKNLEDSVVRATNQFPDIALALLATVGKLNALMDQVEQERLPTRTSGTLAEANAAMSELKKQLRGLKAAELSAQAEQNLNQFNQTLQRVDRLVQRLESDEGLMRAAERAASSLNEVARGAQTVGPEFELTLREVKSAARSVRRFTDALERDPDMLLKGRATAVAR
jgi:phospholipid/cholesterol/gamma-HCH transport system substrate-binding protein